MLQSEYLRLPVGAHIPTAYHEHLDSLARWVRGGHWTEVEADLIIECVLEYLDPSRPTIRALYERLKKRVGVLSECDDRTYRMPTPRDFRHFVISLPNTLVKQCRIRPPTLLAMNNARQPLSIDHAEIRSEEGRSL